MKVTIAGTKEGGTAKAESIEVDDNGKTTKAESIDKLPKEYQEMAQGRPQGGEVAAASRSDLSSPGRGDSHQPGARPRRVGPPDSVPASIRVHPSGPFVNRRVVGSPAAALPAPITSPDVLLHHLEDLSMRKLFAALAVGLFVAASPSADDKPKAGITKKPYGKTPDGTAVEEYTLTNKNGVTMKVMTYGGDRHRDARPGQGRQDRPTSCLGFDNLDEYLDGHPFFGAIAGRVANRIAKGKFTLDGKEYTLATNNGPNHLHGGKTGFDKRVWKAEPVDGRGGARR